LARVPFSIREAQKADKPFVQSTWLKNYESSDFASCIKKTIYQDRHRAVTERLLGGAKVHTLIATPPDDDLTILAFAVLEHPDVLHYVYTKASFRNFGIARDLVAPAGKRFRYSHRTDAGLGFLERLRREGVQATYDPYAAFPRLK